MRHYIISLTVLAFVFIVSAGEVIVANSSTDELNHETLKKIYLGKKKTWSDGTKIVIVTIKSGSVAESFTKNVVGKSLSQFNMFWKQIVFTGRGSMPKSFSDEQALIDFVAANKGAVGYVSDAKASSIPASVKKKTIN